MTCDHVEYVFARDFVTYIMKNSTNFDPSQFAYYKNETRIFSDNHRRTIDRMLKGGLCYFWQLVDAHKLCFLPYLDNLKTAIIKLTMKLFCQVGPLYPFCNYSSFFKYCFILTTWSLLISAAGFSDVSGIVVRSISGALFGLLHRGALSPKTHREFPNAKINMKLAFMVDDEK